MRVTSPEQYVMGEARARHEASGLWHYVRAYGADAQSAGLAVAEEALRRGWKLDRDSIRTTKSTKGVWQ